MPKCPYSFPARSRAAMIAAMESIGGYGGWNAPHRASYPFAWNVKLQYVPNIETAATLNPFNYDGDQFNAAWDSDFESYMQSGDFDSMIIEAMRGAVEDYSTWPGDDSGQFQFDFAGRSGGWLVLTNAFGLDLRGLDFESLRDPEEWSFSEVRRLYRAVTVMDSDFSREAVRREMLHQVAFARTQWEESRTAEIAELEAEASGDEITARALIGELCEARRRLPVAFPVICKTIRAAIRHALQDRRDSRRKATRLRDGDS